MADNRQSGERIDVERLLAQVDLVAVVGAYVPLKKDGSEFKACCPFHQERTPSFYVSPNKGFVHCFGCGAHHDAIGFVQRYEGVDFVEACRRLGAEDFRPKPEAVPSRVEVPKLQGKWVPLQPVPDDAPALMQASGWTVPLWNPKRNKFTRLKPSRVFDYRTAQGELLGYVLRCDFKDGKITPTITWCIGPDGAKQWCLAHFLAPRPLYGLQALVDKPDAPVLLPEGEKCRAAGAGALAGYAVVSWPGGGKGLKYVDWAPLAGRDVVLWPDADKPGRETMLGYSNFAGRFTLGVAQHLHQVGVRSMHYVDPEGMPPGWDLADALDDGWTPKQLATWASARVADLDVVRG